MDLSVIIPTFQRADILDKTLHALINQNIRKEQFEVIIIDDGSDDNDLTKQIVNKYIKNNNNIKYIYQKNSKQGIARNNGIKHAKGRIILFIGDDIIPANNQFLYEHINTHNKNPKENIAVLGLTNWHPELQINDFMKWLTNGSCVLGKYGGHQFAYEKLEKQKPDYNFFYTSNISLKKSILKKENFDTSFETYGWEDIELGYRLTKKYNLKIIYNKKAIGLHHHIITLESLASKMRMIARSAKVIDKKYPELKKTPSKKRIFIFKIISSQFTLQILKVLSRISKNIKNYYYFALSKKYYLEGLK